MGQNVGKGAHYRYQIYTLVTVSDIYSGHHLKNVSVYRTMGVIWIQMDKKAY